MGGGGVSYRDNTPVVSLICFNLFTDTGLTGFEFELNSSLLAFENISCIALAE